VLPRLAGPGVAWELGFGSSPGDEKETSPATGKMAIARDEEHTRPWRVCGPGWRRGGRVLYQSAPTDLPS